MCSFGSCQTRFEFLSQFRKVRNVFCNTGANAFAKNQTRLAYEDKRDLYCIGVISKTLIDLQHGFIRTQVVAAAEHSAMAIGYAQTCLDTHLADINIKDFAMIREALVQWVPNLSDTRFSSTPTIWPQRLSSADSELLAPSIVIF